MRWIKAISVVKAVFLIAACPGRAAEPNGSAAENVSGDWTRREAQVAKLLPDQVAKFRQRASASASAISGVLEARGVDNDNLFAIELEPNLFVALRYREYDGTSYVEDMRRLEQDGQYRRWAEELEECLADGWSDLRCVFYTEGQPRSRVAEEQVKRIARVVGLRPEMAAPYELLHAHTWPGVLAAIREGNIRNYSIYLAPIGSNLYLFAYLEYVGEDFESDMAQIGSDPHTKAWIKFTDEGCQLPIPTRKTGEWWASMERL
jgi:L-rhamnose mutarotase